MLKNTNEKIEKNVANHFVSSLVPKKQEILQPKAIYLDYLATTPVDPRVLDAMLPYFTSRFGNPSSRTHKYGWDAEKAVENARKEIAELINAQPDEIIFTSGATEACNIALKGLALFKYKEMNEIEQKDEEIHNENTSNDNENNSNDNTNNSNNDKKKEKVMPHFITVQTEHKAVLSTLRDLELEGYPVTYIKVKNDGQIDMNDLKSQIKPNTVCISVMAVNNEIGTVQNLEEIGKICKENNIIFHTDAAQGVGKINIDVKKANIGMMGMSGHKIYGPKGVGALYIRRRPRIRIKPIISGGGQERGIRSGTVPTPLVVGMGHAARICKQEMVRDYEHVKRLSEKLERYLKNNLEYVHRNGGYEMESTQKIENQQRENNKKIESTQKIETISNMANAGQYPGCLNLSFAYVEGEGLIMTLNGISLSSGSACTSASLEPSYTLRALGKDEDLAHSSIRYGIGRFTTDAEIEKAGKLSVEAVKKLREMSPLYEMAQDGVDLKSINWST